MACTLLKIVQAAVNLRRRFECAIQSSFESVESGEALEERENLDEAEENGQETQPCQADMTTSEHLSQNFQLSFTDADEGIEDIGGPFQESKGCTKTDEMTFIHSEDPQDSEGRENDTYKDAAASNSIEVIEENEYIIESGDSSPTTTENGEVTESGSNSPTTTENEEVTESRNSSPLTTENEEGTEIANISPTNIENDEVNESGNTTLLTKGNSNDGAIHKIPTVQVNEISGSDRSSSDSDTDSRCSVKSVRLRYADAVSPSSGCKPAKLIRSDALERNAEKEANNLQWVLFVKESGSQLLKASLKDNSDSATESDGDKSELMGYSQWLMKGKKSMDAAVTSSIEKDLESHDNISCDESDEVEDEENDDFDRGENSEGSGDGSGGDDDSEDYLDDDEMMVEESFDESFVDDGFVSLEIDEYDDYDDDVIIEENEEDFERERLEEQMLELRRHLGIGPGRGEVPEHRKLSRQYSPAVYLADPLPGIPETKAVKEAKEEPPGGRLRYTSSSRSGRGSKKSLRSPPVQRQRCVQLDGGDGEEDGAGGQRSPRPHPSTPDHHRDTVLEVEPIRVSSETPSLEVPLLVVATGEGGTRTQALHRMRGRPAYAHSASAGEPLPRTHTYHKYASASFDLAKSSRHEGARAAFHTTRSSFEGDRRLSLSASGCRVPCESVLPPQISFDKSPGSARHLPSMETGSRPCSSASNSDRTLKECGPRGGFRRSRSERVGGSSAGSSPARSESLRVSRSRAHHQDVEMTELCSPRRLHSYEEYSTSRLVSDTSPRGTMVTSVDTNITTSARFSWRSVGIAGRRQSSLESGELEDLMENRRHVEQRRLLLQADSTTPSDEDEEPRSKVRYNDMGSLEQVNEEMADLLDDSSVASTETHEKIKVQCRALWQLRATFEEEDPEEPDSDSIRMEVLSSPDHHSPDVENVTSATSHTTSFESNTDAIPGNEAGVGVSEGVTQIVATDVEESLHHIPVETEESEATQLPITLPSSEARRTSYRAILANRLKQLDASTRPPMSSENSFDSVDTECSSTTDLSRPEALTTSFDSTTDCPTDSTSDTHSHRLQQMKADSGYRSLEANNGRPPKLSKKQIHFMEESLEVVEGDIERDRSRERPRDCYITQEASDIPGDPQSKRERLRKSVAQFERRSGKSLAKKRREALRERHMSLDSALSSPFIGQIGVGGSLEADANTTDEISGKRSVLMRFLRTHRYPTAHYRLLQRDYSIDEKSDRLFKEFSRTEAPLDWESVGRRSTRLYTGRRLHRHLDAEGSPRSHRRKLSPQDSIEEEDQMAAALWEGEVSRPESLADSVGGEEVPPFPLPEETE